MKYSELTGRILFSLIFLMTAMSHFSSQTIQYAESAGVPFASLAVPLSGILAVLGGLSIMLGFKIKAGAWLIVLFLLPVTFSMHAFWNIADPMMKQMQMIMFFKNISLLGGALAFTYNGAGPFSVDNRIASEKVKSSHINFGRTVKA